jgi:D-tyrosyl-tRNA(Tyr) deacylase
LKNYYGRTNCSISETESTTSAYTDLDKNMMREEKTKGELVVARSRAASKSSMWDLPETMSMARRGGRWPCRDQGS